MRSKLIFTAAAGAVLSCLPAPAGAQAGDDTTTVYRREVFHYSRAGRPDPFRSLLRSTELGLRLEDLTLRGVVYHADPARSVAVLSRKGSDRPVRARVGDRIGGIRILSIQPRSVEVLIEEFGVARRGSLELRPASQKGETS